ncbi:MAG: acyl carrier protein [Chitinophagales bacterium]
MLDLEKKITLIISEYLHLEESEVVATANFTDDLGADSLDIVDLLVELEKKFNIIIPDEEAAGLTTVGQLTDYMTNALNTKR